MTESVTADSTEGKTLLEGLGLRNSILKEAVEESERARLRYTLNHPRTLPALSAWGEAICALRERLIPDGWVRTDDGGIPTVFNPKINVSLAVITGDQATGNAEGDLRSKNKRGPSTVALVEQNAIQLEFDFNDENETQLFLKSKKAPLPITWYLVIHRTVTEIRYELALPMMIGIDGHIEGWKERVIFEAITFDGNEPIGTNRKDDDEVSQSEEIVVDVFKKA